MNNPIIQYVIQFFQGFPPELTVFILAFLPITEKVALAIGIAGLGLPAWEAFVWVLLGNLIPILVILGLAERVHAWMSQNSGFFGKAWAKGIIHVQEKFARYQKYELWGLFIFMALPLPVNGGITASLIAFVLGMPAKKAFPYLFAGVVVSNLITLAVTLGVVKIF